jgi:hypothetical protein
MPIPNLTDETPINQYTANSGETEFAFTFYIFALSDIKVYANDVLKTITTDYVVRKNDGTAIGDADLPMDGGKIIFNVGRAAGEKISLNRDIPVDRSTQFSTGGAFKADSLNSELTRILTIAQQLKRDVARSFRLAPSDAEGGSLQLPTDRADNILAFDSNSNLILTKFADIDKANVSPFIATLLDDVSASIARGTLNAQELNANLTTLAGLAGVANLTALANLSGSANKIPYFTGSGAMALRDLLSTTTNQGVAFLSNPVQVVNAGSNPNDTIDFGAGTFITSSGNQIYLPTITKKIQSSGSFTAGSGNNGLDTGARASNTFYRTFVIQNNSTLAYDILFSTSRTSPTVPSGYTNLGIMDYAMIRVNGSTNIASSKWDARNKELVLGAGESITFISDLNNASAGNIAIIDTTESLKFGVRGTFSLGGLGSSDFYIYGSESSSSDGNDGGVLIATNNGFNASGGDLINTSDGKVYWKHFLTSGGIIARQGKIKTIQIRN